MTMATSKFKTRAQMLGIRPKIMAERTKGQLAKLRNKAEMLAHPWIGVDGSVQTAADELGRAFDAFAAHLDGSVEYLNEPPEL